ncbi:type III-B CRISPR module RAMP protein Cmr1 [Cronbergia sp. UHCC 0137]|uniref:type III-B CRISPR module RAMP protein Cmr1 n=1 Tax=Cronbergia sp. UHCC 0137 TaxID=3110239 RepID=UPI002B1FFE89|nr:type III-B CRISPR module RAMP protein Cmr1 [Cronbergia sp. UHCC 0137]MEA5617953.1 type III-B CRISPR module RAMP protein Cmr1 [Cronbergia sp. UHCC 0137]
MEVKIQTLTPIWTGGVETGKVDRIHETGLLGSLRWWMEVLVRGMGGVVCDPTAESDSCGEHSDRNSLDQKKYHQSQATDQRQKLRDGGLFCDVSHIFGATGWKRQFRLSVSEIKETSNWERASLQITPQDRTRGWFLNPGWLGTFTLNFHGDPETLAKLYTLIRFMETYGSLGARPQLGYGIFRIVENPPESKSTCLSYNQHDQQSVSEFPDLRTFTFFKLRFTPRKSTWWHTVPGIRELRGKRDSWAELEQLAKNGTIPTTPALKNYLRYGQQWSNPALPHWLFGTIRYEERLRSKVAFGWAYQLEDTKDWEIRGWVYLPQDKNGRIFRREIVNVFQDKLGKPQTWLTALGLETTDYSAANLTLLPRDKPWQIHSVSDVEAFLKNTVEEHSHDQ